MRGDVQAVREILAGTDPAATPPRSDDAVERVLHRVLTAGDDPASPPVPGGRIPSPRVPGRRVPNQRGPGPRGPGRRGRGRRRLLVAGASLATVVAVLLSVGVLGERATIDPASAAAIRQAAHVAMTGPDPGPFTAGRVWYERSLSRQPMTVAMAGRDTDYVVNITVRQETWLAADGSQRIRHQVVGEPAFKSPADRRRWQADGSPSNIFTAHNVDETIRPGNGVDPLAGYRKLTALPIDPAALFRHFEAKARGHSTGTYPEMFTLVSDALREAAPVPAALRAALYEVLARIPGVRLVEKTTDLAGRPAAALVMPTEALLGAVRSQEELLFDPATAEPRGSRTVVTRNLTPFGDRAGTVTGYSTIEARGFTDSLRSTEIHR